MPPRGQQRTPVLTTRRHRAPRPAPHPHTFEGVQGSPLLSASQELKAVAWTWSGRPSSAPCPGPLTNSGGLLTWRLGGQDQGEAGSFHGKSLPRPLPWPHFSLVTSIKAPFPDRTTFPGLEVRNSTYGSGGDSSAMADSSLKRMKSMSPRVSCRY